MMEWSFARESFSGLQNGRRRVPVDEAWSLWPMVPLDMTMEMYMGHFMLGLTDRVTLGAMFVWTGHRMNVRMADSLMVGHPPSSDGDPAGSDPFERHSHRTSGWSDTELGLLVRILEGDGRRAHLQLGVGMPTGSIDRNDEGMVPELSRMGYAMQLGSGSWEARPGFSYAHEAARWGSEARVGWVVRLHENSAGYRRGAEANASLSVHLRQSEWLLPGVRTEVRNRRNVAGRDPALDPAVSPENDPHRQGGTRVRAYLFTDLRIPSGPLAGHRMRIEWGALLAESVDGPQLSPSSTLNVSYGFSGRRLATPSTGHASARASSTP